MHQLLLLSNRQAHRLTEPFLVMDEILCHNAVPRLFKVDKIKLNILQKKQHLTSECRIESGVDFCLCWMHLRLVEKFRQVSFLQTIVHR